MAYMLDILLLTMLLLSVCDAYPSGPPHSVCWSALPTHTKGGKRIKPQTTPCPYQITVNATTLKHGDTLKVKVSSRPDQDEWFRGLLLQVKQIHKFEGDTFINIPIGSYKRLRLNTRLATCHVSQDTLTHKDGYIKENTEFEWKAPVLLTRDIVFRATILSNFSTFWTDVESPVIRLVDRGRLPAEELEKPWLREIINTIKIQGDRKAEEAATVARFEKGYRGGFDPDGYLMVQYVTEILPFENKFKRKGNKTSSRDATTTAIGNVGPVLVSDRTPRYKKLVRALLNGDYSVIGELERWLDANEG